MITGARPPTPEPPLRQADVALLVAVPLLVALEWTAAGLLGFDARLAIYGLASVMFSLDGFDLVMRVYMRHVHTGAGRDGRYSPLSFPLDVGHFTPYQMRLHLRPWAILVSVHNLAPDELEAFVEGNRPFLDRLWVIDDASTDDTFARLQQAGVRSIRTETNLKKPGAIRRLLAELPREIATVIVLDPDTHVLPAGNGRILDVEEVLFEFQRSRMAALSGRFLVRDEGWLTQMQAIEYAMACSIGRKSLGSRSITGGAAVYRRDALESVLAEHSLSVYAEDLENTFLLLGRGERIYYDGRLLLETRVKTTWSGWFSQRVGWSYGLARVYAQHWRDVGRAARPQVAFVYQYVVYMGVFMLLFHPLRVLGALLLIVSFLNGLDALLGAGAIPDSTWTTPTFFVLAFLKFLVVMTAAVVLSSRGAARWRALARLPGYLVYAIAHVAPVTVGYANWLALRFLGRRVYRDHYESEASLRESLRRVRA